MIELEVVQTFKDKQKIEELLSRYPKVTLSQLDLIGPPLLTSHLSSEYADTTLKCNLICKQDNLAFFKLMGERSTLNHPCTNYYDTFYASVEFINNADKVEICTAQSIQDLIISVRLSQLKREKEENFGFVKV